MKLQEKCLSGGTPQVLACGELGFLGRVPDWGGCTYCAKRRPQRLLNGSTVIFNAYVLSLKTPFLPVFTISFVPARFPQWILKEHKGAQRWSIQTRLSQTKSSALIAEKKLRDKTTRDFFICLLCKVCPSCANVIGEEDPGLYVDNFPDILTEDSIKLCSVPFCRRLAILWPHYPLLHDYPCCPQCLWMVIEDAEHQEMIVDYDKYDQGPDSDCEAAFYGEDCRSPSPAA